jgi:hypothetical protein
MPKMKFTKLALDKLVAPTGERVDYCDTETPGLGLRVGSNSKTFFVKIDVKDSGTKTGYRSVRQTLGRFGELTLEQARREFLGYDDREKGFVPGACLVIKRGKTSVYGSDVTLGRMLEGVLSGEEDCRG